MKIAKTNEKEETEIEVRGRRTSASMELDRSEQHNELLVCRKLHNLVDAMYHCIMPTFRNFLRYNGSFPGNLTAPLTVGHQRNSAKPRFASIYCETHLLHRDQGVIDKVR